ncbi:DUF3320 domain-containing protein, partial [Xenorhabdus bovienii]
QIEYKKYRVTDFSAFASSINLGKFYDTEYDNTLCQLIAYVLEQEAPLLDTLLVQRIARAHGFSKAGRLIRERVLAIVDGNHFIKADKISGDFVWVSQEQSEIWHQVR